MGEAYKEFYDECLFIGTYVDEAGKKRIRINDKRRKSYGLDFPLGTDDTVGSFVDYYIKRVKEEEEMWLRKNPDFSLPEKLDHQDNPYEFYTSRQVWGIPFKDIQEDYYKPCKS